MDCKPFAKWLWWVLFLGIILGVCDCFLGAELTVLPNGAKQNARIVESDRAGSWMIFAPSASAVKLSTAIGNDGSVVFDPRYFLGMFNPTKPTRVYADGRAALVTGPAGAYIAVLFYAGENEGQIDWTAVQFTMEGGGNDGDGDGNGDDPPPGKRTVVVIYTVGQGLSPPLLQGIQKYCLAHNPQHLYRLAGDKDVGVDGKQPAWLLKYLAKMREANVPTPAIIVIAVHKGKEYVWVNRLPGTVDEAVKLIKKYGG